MADTRQKVTLPADTIPLRTYADLDLYLTKFAEGQLDLVLLIGRPGTGKTQAVRRSLGLLNPQQATADPETVLYVEGHARPFGLYRQLFQLRDCPVVLDDLDRLYADADCVRLLKPLCSGTRTKRIAWLTNATANSPDLPPAFVTTSTVLLIANEWRSVNANVRALEDRAIILHFDPANAEVHEQVSSWFDDPEVYEFIASVLEHVPVVSMRHYEKGRRLRHAGLRDWKNSLLQMMLHRDELALIAALRADPQLLTEKQRVQRFTEATGRSRPTYYRLKRLLT